MDMKEKRRAHGVLKNLPAEKQEAIIARLDGPGCENYTATAEWLKKDGISATPQMVSKFRSWYLLREELWDDEDFATEMTAICMEKGWIKTAREERAAAQIFFNRLVARKRDPKMWSMVERVNLAKDKVTLEEKELALKARKLRGKEKKDSKANGTGMTDEEKEKAIRQIYGMS